MMDNSRVVNTYPLSSYHFYIKDQKTEKNYSVRARLSRLRLNYSIEGMKRSVEGVLLVQEHNFPYVLVFKIGDTLHKLPGGKLRPGEDEIEGLKRKLSSKFARNNPEHQQNWQIRECLGIWWRPNFDNVLYPYCDSHIQPKECTKIYLVQLSAGESLGVPENFKLLAVPLFELHDNGKYGRVLSSIPRQLSTFRFNHISP
ncbi:hypothetical protein RND81_14G117500 [Saponaria officinalis]|uniref:Pre-mRNA cleavage factor Im 25 kDa subunit n=1 Tax=Saponaria officinalis TaxID=3572 RepID=A0AAW1GL20_SAPOF